ERGKSIRSIANDLKIDRKTVRKIKIKIETNGGEIECPKIHRSSVCDPYKDTIQEWLKKGLTGQLIYERLQRQYRFSHSYGCVRNYVKKLKGKEEVYVPVQTASGEEMQVDFGYMGTFKDEAGKRRKIWVFVSVLSHSRYAYYELVKDQTVDTFIRCHENAFHFFGGVPKIVRIDNLKAGVMEVNFYEPIYQKEYHHFLSHYGASGITCRVRRGQDKGKVESGVKFVKYNFLKGLQTNELREAKRELNEWMNKKNQRCHGTTKEIPASVFKEKEKAHLITLTETRYPQYRCEKRRVNDYGHVAYQYNFYSVPYRLAGEDVYVKSDGSLLRIYHNTEQVTCHSITQSKGNYITKEGHKVSFKQHKSAQTYLTQALGLGADVYQFIVHLKQKHPTNWMRMSAGVIRLAHRPYTPCIVNAACRRAVIYKALSYQSVRQICEKNLYTLDDTPVSAVTNNSGYSIDLSVYDLLTGANS
ncbi:MAG: IS21 family transposase, partial [Lentisphaerae bacterium]|nr:IS21 family transposase [Lentisphaerota bacterium]